MGCLFCVLASGQTVSNATPKEKIFANIAKQTIADADSFLSLAPVTVTAAQCGRSAGGIHDFYSEGDYWWPDPENPDGPYIQKDGQSNPGNFSDHRLAMTRLSEITATLTSAWLLRKDPQYARKALEHLNAWFVDTATLMNPDMLYAQAIKGRFTGRSIGLIDAYHLVEVAQSVRILSEEGGITPGQVAPLKAWFARFLEWMTTHEYGIKEMNAENNHGTCWVTTAAAFASVTGDEEKLAFCRDRFKTLLSSQMDPDGSFPREIKRTKPYGYSLFNMDAFANAAQILSTPEDNLWEFATPDGKSLRKGMEFIYPFIADKTSWPFAKDIYIWEEWPVRQSCLLFAGIAYDNQAYIDTYLRLPSESGSPRSHQEPSGAPPGYLEINKAISINIAYDFPKVEKFYLWTKIH